MNITGAELIIRFLESRSSIGDGAVAGVQFFDFRNGLADARRILKTAQTQQRAVVCIAVQVRRNLIGTEAHQPAETRRVLDAATKSWFHIGAAMELLELLPEAFRLACTPQRGPVLLEIPEDVLMEQIQGAWIPQVSQRTTPSTMTSMLYA